MQQSPTDKLAVPQLAKKFPAVYGTSKSLTVYITAHRPNLVFTISVSTMVPSLCAVR